MKKQNISGFASKIVKMCDRYKQFPINGQIELTYICNLNCVHCYCKGLGDKSSELKTGDWKKIINEIQKEGCLDLCITGGEPLIRKDFLEIYAHAKSRGFLITIFTNGTLFTQKIINYLEKSPPSSIEITLNGITERTYESITQVPGSYVLAMDTINKLAKMNMHLILKSNCLKENKHEISKIKSFTHQLFGQKKKRFKYDPFVFPRFNGDKTPCNHRLSSKELLEVRKTDPEIWKQYQKSLCKTMPKFKRERDYLYHCDAWKTNFFISPSGRLKFCALTDDYSVDLKSTAFKEGFYNVFSGVLNERFQTDSKCKNCDLRTICYACPSRAYLEGGDKEVKVEYYCQLAKDKN